MNQPILVVEDDEQVANSLSEYLELSGYRVDRARELEEAQTLLSHIDYCLVITDLRLGQRGFTGLDILQQIRELSLPTRTIVITGYGWPELQAEASAMGAYAFMQKPVLLRDLENTLSMLTGVDA